MQLQYRLHHPPGFTQQQHWLEYQKKAPWAAREELLQEERGPHPPSLSLKSSRGARVKDPLRTVLSAHCV